ncbi:ABC transporter permease [Neobacillus mesonae]|uniref:ABC transporter permease n=1 Tax=Neobacillus mesonae TaxID=1193713 RepID=UPI00203E9472|nr:ABC transporter permease [Neobacillus mesonae]MCM3568971.1 ABC transporter permease [Neobacillus mesonae]
MISKEKVENNNINMGQYQFNTKLFSWFGEHKQVLSIFLIFLIISAYFGMSTNSFFTSSNFMNLIQQLAPNLIVVVAMTFVITTAGIDLSVGSVIALASAITAILLEAGFNSPITLVIVLLAGVMVGIVNGYISAYHDIPPFIVTLSSMIFIRGFALLLTGGYSIAIAKEHGLVNIGIGTLFGVPVAALIAIIIVILGAIALRSSRFGIYVIGIGANEESVRRSGVDTRKIKLLTYMMSGGAAALAGLIISSRLGSGSSNIGLMFEMDVIAAVVLGGTSLFGGKGTMMGSLIGVSIIGVIKNGLILMQVSPDIIQIIQGMVLLLAVILNIRIFGNRRK